MIYYPRQHKGKPAANRPAKRGTFHVSDVVLRQMGEKATPATKQKPASG